MKKSLVALAALAVVGVASAQSSVTMYGVADVAVMKSTGSKAGGRANSVFNNGNSRLGVRGNEDLGGGLKAFFNFEQGIDLGNGNTDDSAMVTTCNAIRLVPVPTTITPVCGTASTVGTFQRAAYVGLGGSFGEVYAGRRLGAGFYAVGTYELTGMASYSAVVTQFGQGGPARESASAAYTSPSFGGFTATLGGRLASNSTNNRDMIMGNLIYKQGPIAAAASYHKVENEARSLTLGGSYDFGMAKVAVGFYDPAVLAKGFSVGASMPLGPVVLTLDVARQTEGFDDTDLLLEAKYALSKRTFAYAIGQRNENGAAAPARTRTNTFGMGVRHNF